MGSDLAGVKKIYFAAYGALHGLSIEYAILEDGSRWNDHYDIYRLSSTRELIRRKEPVMGKNNVVIFGGLDYDVDPAELMAESKQIGAISNTPPNRSLQLNNVRYGVNFLPGTLTEVNAIFDDFTANNITPTIVVGSSGTEEKFKALAAKGPSILHLATHGFFWSEEKASTHNYINLISTSLNPELYHDEQVMIRSGLLFSGANASLKGEPIPDDVEDGILTAQELSNMNLGSVDLVVMSACESGLGKISGEGVFGLQRGFKLAGANSLLMSLWKVDDQATCLLMTEFYKNLLSGKTKQESLYLAQKVLRDSEEYSDPEYWAAFILLDALN